MQKNINEEQGVSSDVRFFTKTFLDKIEEELPKVKFNMHHYRYNDETTGYIIECPIEIGTIELHDVFSFKDVIVLIYDFMDRETMANLFYKMKPESGFNKKTSSIEICFPSVNKKLYLPVTKDIISHELMHYYKTSFNALKVNKLYNYALSVINNRNIPENDINKTIAWVLYLLDDQEIDANCQGGYEEGIDKRLRTIDEIKTRSQLYNNKRIVKEYVDTIQSDANRCAKYRPELFGNKSLSSVIIYIDGQLKYYLYKVDRVFNKIITDNNKHINEGFISEHYRKMKISL